MDCLDKKSELALYEQVVFKCESFHTALSFIMFFLFHFIRKYVSQLVTGYLPSVILVLFFYTVPPLMILFSTIEGSISRSGRKRGACCKVLFFTIWNVFFVNIASGTVLNKLSVFSQPKDIPLQLAAGAVPAAVRVCCFCFIVLLSSQLLMFETILFPLIPLFLTKKHFGNAKIDNPSSS